MDQLPQANRKFCIALSSICLYRVVTYFLCEFVFYPSASYLYRKSSTGTWGNQPLVLCAKRAHMQTPATTYRFWLLSQLSQADFWDSPNSAINAVPSTETAFSHHSTLYTFKLYASSSISAPPYPSDGISFVNSEFNHIQHVGFRFWDV